MQARINNPALIHADTMKAMMALKKSCEGKGVPSRTLELVELRASQINGCAACVDMHARQARQTGETDERLYSIAVWREAPFFTDAERAALALTESVTRIADRPDAVSDAVWAEAARHFDEPALAALVVAIANINVWNRFNVAVRQPVGSFN